MKRGTFIKLLGASCSMPGGWLREKGSPYLRIVPGKASFHFFSIDSLGKGQLSANVALAGDNTDKKPTDNPGDALDRNNTSGTRDRNNTSATLDRNNTSGALDSNWKLDLRRRSFTLSAEDGDPFVFNIDQHANHATLLGMMSETGPFVQLPAILHFPDMGTLRVTGDRPGLEVTYDAKRFIDHPYVRVSFSAGATYHFEVVCIHPRIKGRFDDDSFRRNFISIFQLNPFLRVLANNSSSDACVFTLYLYSEIARHTPPLAPGLTALDLIRATLDRYLSGQKGYGLLGYDYDKTWDIPESATTCNTLDSYPSLLIAVCNYVEGSGDKAWFERNTTKIREWGERMLQTDTDGDGLLEFCLSGNSGTWKGDKSMRPANWWDTIGFGHKDAYSNALAYRALLLLEGLYQDGYFGARAVRLKERYQSTFYNPATGVLAGWKSADGGLHDYYFTFVNGMAICHGLVDTHTANTIMDTLLSKMKQVGFTDFSIGLPGNLIPIAAADYTDLAEDAGGGPNGFQVYENGGATACFAYYTITALQKLGRQGEADAILLPMLGGSFQGPCPNGRSRDWRTWTGKCWGYEGFLVDNYMYLLSVLGRVAVILLLFCGKAAAQKMEIGPLSLVSYSLRVHPADSGCRSYIRFYNTSDSLLLEYESPCNDTSTGFYTESPAGSSYMVIDLKHGTRLGEPVIDRYTIPPSTPRISLDQYLSPFWRGDTVYNETVLLQPDSGRLLYEPREIISVRSFDLDTTYVQGRDYTLNGNSLIRLPGSSMPSYPDTTLGDLGWYNLQSKWIVVTYTHKDKWTGPIPPAKGSRLPRLMAKLAAHKPVTIAAYGMSITRGMDGSAYDQVSPYTPNYMDMMLYGLKRRYKYAAIKFYNAGLPGSTIDWGAQYADQYINPLHPDLVVVDFGMNDFWRLTPKAFKGYIRTILQKIRAGNPSVEFLLIANMQFDPAYIADSDKYKAFYLANMQGYRSVLLSLQGPGVVTLDMNTISGALYQRKKAKDCISNPLHPNDYMSRWYAQGLLETLRR